MAMFEELEGPHAMRPRKQRRPLGAGAVHPVDRLRAVALGATAAAGIDDPDAHEELFQGIVWLGDLSGWEIGIMRRHSHAGGDAVCLYHRCGWSEPVAPCGTADDHAVYLGNLVERALEVAATHTCAPHEPSEEHKARVAAWEASRRAEDLGAERVSGPPVQRPGLLYAAAPGLATPQHRPVDGPGCTPAFVPGVLRSVHAFNGGASSANVECLGEQCTGCSDSQCWTAQADGGDV